jgi:hypothetical protein
MVKWKVGDRAWSTEGDNVGLCKIIEIRDDNWYLVREYKHPHRIVWTDDVHLTEPQEMRHDPRTPLFEDEF